MARLTGEQDRVAAHRPADRPGQPQGADARGRRPDRRLPAPAPRGRRRPPLRPAGARHRPVQVRQRRARATRSATGCWSRSATGCGRAVPRRRPGGPARRRRVRRGGAASSTTVDEARRTAAHASRTCCRVPVVLDGLSLDVGGSIGIAIYPAARRRLRHPDAPRRRGDVRREEPRRRRSRCTRPRPTTTRRPGSSLLADLRRAPGEPGLRRGRVLLPAAGRDGLRRRWSGWRRCCAGTTRIAA